MTGVCRAIFKAIHEGKWLSIEYRNKEERATNYWIGIKNIDLRYRSLLVDGLYIGRQKRITELTIYIDSIQSASVIEGSYCPIIQSLINDIKLFPEKYAGIFDHIPNLKILNYLSDCNRLDSQPCQCDYELIKQIDDDSFNDGAFKLNDQQFDTIVDSFQHDCQSAKSKKNVRLRKQIGLNIISIPLRHGLYVLAYRKLQLDVNTRSLKADKAITFCRKFSISGEDVSIRQFLDEEDLPLLDDPDPNLELIKDLITQNNPQIVGVNDMPYVIALETNIQLDLEQEYAAIVDMYNTDTVTTPIRAFFGELLRRPIRRKRYPFALLNKKINLDQLLAINNAMMYPLAYIQGPPGTGKTNTIMNTILTAFFNDRTVLFASYNNHPIDEVYKKMKKLKYQGRAIPFPIIRLGNTEKVKEALDYMRKVYEYCKKITIFDSTLDKNRDDRIRRTQQLSQMLASYEEKLDLGERREITQSLLNETKQLNFQYELQGKQLSEIDSRLSEIGDIRDEDAKKLMETDNEGELYKYLFYTSAKFIKRLGEPRNKELLDIVYMDSENEERVVRFNQYLSNDDNVKKLQRIFPIVATTCISAHKIGEPKQYFDMVIMDEASQCNNAVSLVPIIRGSNLMLVGDPQQLQPVILLDPADNKALRKKYSISPEYDYLDNSIYKTFLACDSVSDEVLLRYHYRCHPKIIGFNNKKYYNQKLIIKSDIESNKPLVFVNVQNGEAMSKNTSPAEVDEIMSFLRNCPSKSVGIITPFANQRSLINDTLQKTGYADVTCGTVHAFQGDEKDVILFSLGLSDSTKEKTYDWLKNNRELINVATSRARKELVVFGNERNLIRLHQGNEQDDLFELVEYIKSEGTSIVSQRTTSSRALGIKPYSTETEQEFMTNLNHAIDNIQPSGTRYVIHKEVAVSQVFSGNPSFSSLFYTGRFDFVVYERGIQGAEIPILAIELDGKEHIEDETVKYRDAMKNRICREHNFELIRVDNTYARRYHYIKDILIRYFTEGKIS